MTDLFDLPFEEDAEAQSEPSPVQPAAPVRRVLSVTELTVAIRDALEERFFQVWVEGELSNCKQWNGHLYFTLKDDQAQLKGFMFRSSLRYLKFRPADGLRDAARKRPLPALPRKIGIVTSLEGAAVRDIIKVLARRYRNAQLVIRPARVQGDGAASEVARGLRAIARVPGVDVVIVGRGGGSIEDLWAFNEEIVARAIAQCPVPVISAVGHETDTTIADFVADRRAPTPSAAAEIVVAAHDEFCSRVDRLQDRLRAAARSRVQGWSRRVHMLSGRSALAGFPARLAMRGRHVSELTHALDGGLRAQV